MKKTTAMLSLGFSTLVLAGACKSDEGPDPETSELSPQCDSPDGYIAFDPANHQNQDLRLAAIDDMNELMSAAVDEDGGLVDGKFTQAKAIYTDAAKSADLRTKVMGRLDEHVDGSPEQGSRLDATIMAFLEAGEDAATGLEAKVAKQWVDKTLQEFVFLSVHHELIAGDRAHWDEAFGYFGSQSDAEEKALSGLARTAFKRDGINGTDLLPDTFNALIDGACVLDMELADEESAPLSELEGLPAVIDEIDGAMQKVLAYSAGHEAFEMLELIEDGASDTDEIVIKAAELVPFFIPLERIMIDHGGESKKRAQAIRAQLDLMPTADGEPDAEALADTAWIQEVNPQAILSALEAEFSIDIKG